MRKSHGHFGDSGENDYGMIREFGKLKTKVESLTSDFVKKRKELVETFDGKPEVTLLLRKEDGFVENLESTFNNFVKDNLKGKLITNAQKTLWFFNKIDDLNMWFYDIPNVVFT